MKTIAKALLLLLVTVSLAFTTFQKNSEKPIVAVIDVSHGGEDSGTSNGNLLEKELVQQIANKMALLNKGSNIHLHFTRTSDSYVSLQDRVTFINNLKPDMVLSIHINENKDASTSGMDVFYADKGKNPVSSEKLAHKVVNAMEAKGIFSRSKVKPANFFVLKHSEAPSVVVELGFLSNAEDSKILTDDTQQEEIAKVLLTAINNQ